MTTPSTSPTFAEWLASYGAGTLDDRLTAALGEIAQAVQLLDKSGKLTLTINVTAKAGGVVVTPDIKATVPESKSSGQFFYVASDGTLSRRDPAQPQLPTMENS